MRPCELGPHADRLAALPRKNERYGHGITRVAPRRLEARDTSRATPVKRPRGVVFQAKVRISRAVTRSGWRLNGRPLSISTRAAGQVPGSRCLRSFGSFGPF